MQGLTVGRMVHWVSDWSGEHFAAVITDVIPNRAGVVQLMVLHPYDRQCRFVDGVPYDEAPDPVKGTWHWIERA